MKSKSPIKRLKHLLIYTTALPILGLLRVLPNGMASTVGAWVGRAVGALANDGVPMVNLGIAFPTMAETDKKSIIAPMWQILGRSFVDMVRIDKMDVENSVTIQGAEHYINAVKQGHGTIVATAHLGGWEICGAVIDHVNSTHHINATQGDASKPFAIYSKPSNDYIADFVYKKRQKHLYAQLSKDDPQTPMAMVRLFKQGRTCIMVSDQKFNKGVTVPFFGRDALCASGFARFASRGIPVIPMQVIRGENGTSFTVVFHPPLSVPNTGDEQTDHCTLMQNLNTHYENWITQNPDQYVWIHRRWERELYP